MSGWFEIPEAREQYIKECRGQIFLAAKENNKTTGFICLKETGKDTAEIAVMGVLKEYHRQGTGKKLVMAAKDIPSCKLKQSRWGYIKTMIKQISFTAMWGLKNLRYFQCYGIKTIHARFM